MMGAILKKEANCLLFFAFYFFVGLLVVQSSCTPLRFAYANLTPSNFYTGRAGSLRDTAHLPKSSLTDSDCIRNHRRFFPPLAFDIFTGLVIFTRKTILNRFAASPTESFTRGAIFKKSTQVIFYMPLNREVSLRLLENTQALHCNRKSCQKYNCENLKTDYF